MNSLEESRKEINELDRELSALFERRMKLSGRIAEYKSSAGLDVKDEAREKELIQRNLSYISEPAIEPYYARFLRSVIDLSCDYQSSLLSGQSVAYSGQEGAFAHIAAKRLFPSARATAYPNFAEAYKAAESGECSCAVLPIENSYAGEVGEVMDLLFSGGLYINRVTDVPIAHCLLSNPGADKAGIKEVVSHPQALEQCEKFLSSLGASTRSYVNTALAAKYVKESGRTDIAALASKECADIFELNVLAENIHDSKTNITRFAVFSPVCAVNTSPDGSFILLFTVRNQAGALAEALNIIGSHGYNMRALRSRPMKTLSWSYYFYVECEGCVDCPDGKNMLRELGAVCSNLRLAGAFASPDIAK